MKRTLLLAGFAFLLGATTYAATDKSTSIKARATALARVQVEKAHLDEGQYVQVKSLNIRMLTEMEDLKARFAAEPAILDERLAVAQARYELELTALMRPSQLALFNQARNNMTALTEPR